MKKPMGEQHGHFVERTFALLTGLFSGGGDAHDHIPERAACELGERAFLQRKGEDVGGAIFFPIDAIEIVDARVVVSRNETSRLSI
jgi:hypothetical protein